ncbi:MAG: MFS transporter, partial [Thermoleophilaceae bacterium]|nr:MFS transporter [Thermoleophilaceae bacterium]
MLDSKQYTLLTVCLATFMLLIDITVVNVALPDIQADLDSSFADLQWVVDAYALTLAALLLTAGSLADLFGRRRIFVTGLLLFILASLLCGLAHTPTLLNVARAGQGIGGAGMFATSLAILASAFEGQERAKAIGIWGATIGFSVAMGPLVGGVLTEGLGWEWIFFVNIPVGLGTAWLALRHVEETRNPAQTRVDWGGLVTFSGALFLLVFALIQANDHGWGSADIVARFAGAALLLAAFVVIERRVEQPMLDLTLFRKPSFTGAAIAAFALSASMFAMFLYLTLYMQNVLGYGPLEAGLRFLPLSLLSFVVAPVVGNLTAKVPVRIFLGAGLLMVAFGLLLMRGIEVGSGWTTLLAGFMVAGAGIGMTNPAIATAAVGVVEPARSGMASGINTTFRQVGIATGIAALGALFESRVTSKVTDALASTPAAGSADDIGTAVASGGPRAVVGQAPPAMRDQLEAIARESFISGLNEILLVSMCVAAVGGILALA